MYPIECHAGLVAFPAPIPAFTSDPVQRMYLDFSSSGNVI